MCVSLLSQMAYEVIPLLNCVCHFLFHRLLHNHQLSSGTGTIGQLVTYVPSGPSLTPPHEMKNNKKCIKIVG
jgi:hypothetical protein